MVYQVGLTIGIIFFVIAIIGFLAPISYGMNVSELNSACQDPWAKLGARFMGMVEQFKKECEVLQHMLYLDYLIGFGGIVMIIASVAAKPEKI